MSAEKRAMMPDEATDDEYRGEAHAEARCPVPEWALRPLAVALPVIAVLVVLWFVLHR